MPSPIGFARGLIARTLAGVNRRLARTACAPAGELRNQRWLESALSSGRETAVWVTLRGASMVPAILPGDRVMVTPLRPGEPLREGDIFVARRARRLIAHRLLRSHNGTVILRGDAASADDAPIPLGDVLARVIATRPAPEWRS